MRRKIERQGREKRKNRQGVNTGAPRSVLPAGGLVSERPRCRQPEGAVGAGRYRSGDSNHEPARQGRVAPGADRPVCGCRGTQSCPQRSQTKRRGRRFGQGTRG